MTDPLVVELARPFPARYVKQVQGQDYTPHHVVEQRAIQIFGVPPKIEVLREIYDGEKLTGVVVRMTIQGTQLWSEEAGASDNPQSKTNGDRLKDACSDAYKRCAMRLGLGLHLWAQKDYFLFDALAKDSVPAEPELPHQTAQEPQETGEPSSSSGSPVLRAKRMHLRQLGESRKFDVDAHAHSKFGKVPDDCDLEELEQLISLVQQMQAAS